MRLDEFLPHWHFHEIHSVEVRATPEAVFYAMKTLTLAELSKIIFYLMAVRVLPARLLRPRPAHVEAPVEGKTVFLESMLASGFTKLAEDPGREVVVGLIGQFWKLSPVPAPVASPEVFLRFEEPGWAKVAANLRVEPSPAGARLFTETRILALDPGARRKFGRYWILIRLGSGWIRWLWLYAIKRKAEKAGRDK